MKRRRNSWWEITTMDYKWWFYYWDEECETGNWIDVEKYQERDMQVPFHWGSSSCQQVWHKDYAVYLWGQLPDCFVLQHYYYHKGKRYCNEYTK